LGSTSGILQLQAEKASIFEFMKAFYISMRSIFPAFEVTSTSNQGAFFVHLPEMVYFITFLPHLQSQKYGSSIALMTQYV